MQIINKFKHNFGEQTVLLLENKEISPITATKFLGNMIKGSLKSEKIKIWDFTQDQYNIVFVTDNAESYHLAKKFISSSFGYIILNKVKTKYIKHYQIKIHIKNIDKLIAFLNDKVVYPLYKLTGILPFFKNDKIILKLPDYINTEEVKNTITKSNKVNIRFVYEKHGQKMQTYDGESIFVSEPIIQDSWNYSIISKFSIYDKNVIVMHLSPDTIEKINELRMINNGYNICFEIGGIVYTVFTMRARKKITSDLQLVKCKDNKEAKDLLKRLNIGFFSSLNFIEETKDNYSTLWLMYFLIALNLLLIALFLRINQKRYMTVVIIVASFFFSYFSYNNYSVNINMLLTLYLQTLILFLINKYNEKYQYFGSYFSISYFIINILIHGYGKLFNQPYVEFFSRETLLSSMILLASYNIIKSARFNKNK